VSLSGFAYHTLREQIRTCQLRPGQWLTDREAATQLGIEVFPARAALARLDRDGLVRHTPARGYQITPLTLKSVDDLFLTWRLVGPEIARLAVENASDRHLDRLHRLVDELGTVVGIAATAARIGRFLEIADELFDELAVATTNDRLVEAYRSFTGEMARIWSLIIGDADGPGLPGLGTESWHPALDRHDGHEAARNVRRFIDSSHAAAMHALTY